MRLIDADELWNELGILYHHKQGRVNWNDALLEIKNAPTIEERKTGEWIELDFTEAWEYKCDQCGRLSDFKDNFWRGYERREGMFIACKEFWYDGYLRVYSKRKVGVNIEDISSYFEHYDTGMKKTVLRVCLKNGRYHDIEGDFDTFHETVSNCSENMRGEQHEAD